MARRSASMSLAPARRRFNTLVSWPAPPAEYPKEPPARVMTTVPPPSGVRLRQAPVRSSDHVDAEVELEVVDVMDVDVEDERDELVIALVPREARAPRNPPPLPSPLRMRGLAQLAEERSPWRAAGIAAASLAKALGARSVLVHSIDQRRDEIRTIGVDSPRAPALLGCVAVASDDFVATTVVSNGRAMMLRLDGGLPRVAPKRLSIAGASRSLSAVPIMCGPHCVGLIEIVDADASLLSRVEEACAMVSEHLAILF